MLLYHSVSLPSFFLKVFSLFFRLFFFFLVFLRITQPAVIAAGYAEDLHVSTAKWLESYCRNTNL